MCEIHRFPVRPRPKLVSAKEATFASIEMNAIKAVQGNDLAKICLEAVAQYPHEAKISEAARACLQELAKRKG